MAIRDLASPKVVAQLLANVRNTLDDGQTITGSLAGSVSDALTSGVSANQANRGFQWKEKILASGASIVLDLYDFVNLDAGAGNGNDMVGQALVLEEITAILIVNENDVDTVGQLEVLPDPARGGWTPIGIHTVGTGGALRGGAHIQKYQPAEQGFDVSDGDAGSHRLKLSAVGGDIVYSVYILGRHDDDESSSSSVSASSSSSSPSSSSSSSVRSSSSSSGEQSSSSTSSQSSSSSSSSLNSSSSSSEISTSSSLIPD